LLCTQQPETLLPTILSRCQSLTLRPAPLELLTAWLEERGVAAAAGLTSRDLAQLAGGNPGRALRLAGERTEGGDETWEPVDFLRDVLAAQSDGLYQRINAMDTARDRERLRRFLGELQSWLLDAELVRRLGAEARQRVLHADQYDDLERFATRVRLERPDVVLEQLSEARRLCERNVHTFTLLLTLAHMLRRECAALGRKRTA
jgi:DNA polymerase-3 subunit delta'